MRDHLRPLTIAAVVIAAILAVAFPPAAVAQVDARRELEKLQAEYERYVRDEREYTERTQTHMDGAIRTLIETVGFGALKALFPDHETATDIVEHLYILKNNVDAGLRGDVLGQAEELVKQIAHGIGSGIGAGKLQLSGVVDTVFHLLYLNEDLKQRRMLDSRRETLDRLREYWTDYAAGRRWETPPPQQEEFDPMAPDAIFQRAISQLGVRITTPAQAVAQGSATMAAQARQGYELADVVIVSSADDWLALDFSGSYLVPTDIGSGSQRLGLVSIAAIDGQPITSSAQTAVGPRSLADARIPRVRQAGQVIPAAAQGVATFGRRHWVLVAPRGRAVVTFHSVCLDQHLGIPDQGEEFAISTEPLPSRLQRLLVGASLNNEVPQSEVWQTIATDEVKWWDPRLGPAAMLARAKLQFEGRRYEEAITEGTGVLSTEPDNADAILLLGLSHFRLGLGENDPLRARGHYSQSQQFLRRALGFGKEVSLPVVHHQQVMLDQRLSAGQLTISAKTLRFQSSEAPEQAFEVPLARIYELELEMNRAGRLHTRIGIQRGRSEDKRNFNFLSPEAMVNRETAQLTLGLSLSADTISCTGTCVLPMELVYALLKDLPGIEAK